MPIAHKKLLWRGTSFIVLSSVIALSLFTVFFSNYLSGRYLKRTEDYGKFLLEAIEEGFFQSMLHEDRQSLYRMFEDLSKHGDIEQVVIYDSRGRLSVASGSDRGFPEEVRNKLVETNSRFIVTEYDKDGSHSLILAHSISNEQRCRECHSPDEIELGILGIEFSMKNFDQFNKTSQIIMAVMAAVVGIILMGVNVGFFSRFVVRPIEELNLKIEKVEKGDTDVVFNDRQGDEISDLESSFGAMVKEIERHHEAEIEKEKEMALMVQNLKHQMELSAVNKQLETRLRELDQANRKIKRMASRIEDKNINLAKMVKRISALNRLGVALSSELEMEKLIRLVVSVAVKGLRAERGFLMLIDDQDSKLRMIYGMGLGEEYDQSIPIELGDSISGIVAQTGNPVLIEDMSKENNFRRVSRFGFLRKSVICAPLKVKEHILGVIELTNKKGGEIFNREDVEMMTSMCAQAAIAIDNAKLYQEIQKSYFETVRALIQAVEEKDRYTRGHSERVTLFSIKIAQMMGLDQKLIDVIKYAGYLHDIGKIGIDINILQKQGKLDSEEYEMVKNHPLIGERIIAPIEFLEKTRKCISQHHERYDGFGYPNGINGHDMSLEARILSVADAYDAMITDRPYRRAFPRDHAIAELKRCSGSQFDPEIVEVFIEILETDREIHDLEKKLSSVGT